jgi:N6-L-threonylcarbamoyladenine synthase
MKSKFLRVLAIETSCDETAVSMIGVRERPGQPEEVKVLSHLVSSQVPIHQKYGGVVPEVAARSHVPETVSLLSQALGKQGMKAFDVIAVTRGPGLPTALSVGVEAARTLAWVSGKPLVAVNHLEGHIASAWLDGRKRRDWQYPLLALVVSGGHTELVMVEALGKYRLIGQTRDDAAGEAFDKAAKLMGLPYPGGPQIAKRALQGNPKAFDLPRPMRHDGTYDFSFSGLKTAVRYTWEQVKASGQSLEQATNDMAASVQEAIVDILVEKTVAAAKAERVKGVLLVGGVSANLVLRTRLGKALKRKLPGVAYLPSMKAYITDNATMIAAAGYWRYQLGDLAKWQDVEIDPEWNLG